METELGRLEANGFPSPSAPPFPFPLLVPFGVGSESRAQLHGKEGSGPPKVAPCLLMQGGTRVGMAEPVRAPLPAWGWLGYRAGPAKWRLDWSVWGKNLRFQKCIWLCSGVIHLLLKIPVQQDPGGSERASMASVNLCIGFVNIMEFIRRTELKHPFTMVTSLPGCRSLNTSKEFSCPFLFSFLTVVMKFPQNNCKLVLFCFVFSVKPL